MDSVRVERTRRAARRLVAVEHVVTTHKGVVVEPSRARGPIRLRRVEQIVEPERVRRHCRRDDGDHQFSS